MDEKHDCSTDSDATIINEELEGGPMVELFDILPRITSTPKKNSEETSELPPPLQRKAKVLLETARLNGNAFRSPVIVQKRNKTKPVSSMLMTTKDRLKHWIDEYTKTNYGIYIGCTNCKKWRKVYDYEEPHQVPTIWKCAMNKDSTQNYCDAPEDVNLEFSEGEFVPGSIVWAKMRSYPDWPAMVEDDPDYEDYYWHDSKSRQMYYNVTFLDKNVTRANIAENNIKAFYSDDKIPKLKGKMSMFQKRLASAHLRASKAIELTLAQRLKKYSFLYLYQGPWEKSWPKKKLDEDDKSADKGIDMSEQEENLPQLLPLSLAVTQEAANDSTSFEMSFEQHDEVNITLEITKRKEAESEKDEEKIPDNLEDSKDATVMENVSTNEEKENNLEKHAEKDGNNISTKISENEEPSMKVDEEQDTMNSEEVILAKKESTNGKKPEEKGPNKKTVAKQPKKSKKENKKDDEVASKKTNKEKKKDDEVSSKKTNKEKKKNDEVASKKPKKEIKKKILHHANDEILSYNEKIPIKALKKQPKPPAMNKTKDASEDKENIFILGKKANKKRAEITRKTEEEPAPKKKKAKKDVIKGKNAKEEPKKKKVLKEKNDRLVDKEGGNSDRIKPIFNKKKTGFNPPVANSNAIKDGVKEKYEILKDIGTDQIEVDPCLDEYLDYGENSDPFEL